MSQIRELFREQETLYNELVTSFQEFARTIGGWQSEKGVYLDGKLWELSKKLTAERHLKS